MAIPLQFLTKSLSGNPTPLPHEPINSGSSQASDLDIKIKPHTIWVFTHISISYPFLPPKCGGDAPPVVYILENVLKNCKYKNKIIVVLTHLALKIEDNFHNKCGGNSGEFHHFYIFVCPFPLKMTKI